MCAFRGVYTVSSLDRLDDLRRMVTSLWKHNRVHVQAMIANDWLDANRLKTMCGTLSPFDTTVMLDTDMLVRGDIMPLFSYAAGGELVIHSESDKGPLNTGVVAFTRELGLKLSAEWLPRFTYESGRYDSSGSPRSYYRTDQHVLNKIIGNYPVRPLSGVYNYIIHNHTLEDEAKDWDAVRIFHFIHRACKHRTESRAYKEWMEL